MKVTQLCLTLCNPMDYTVLGILQATRLEWVAMSSSRGSSQPRDQTHVSRIRGGFFTSWATRGRRILEWVAYPVSRGSFRPRNWSGVSCIASVLYQLSYNWIHLFHAKVHSLMHPEQQSPPFRNVSVGILGGSVVKAHLPVQETGVQSLVRGPHAPHGNCARVPPLWSLCQSPGTTAPETTCPLVRAATAVRSLGTAAREQPSSSIPREKPTQQ